VTEEKSSRVIELLLTTVSPRRLLTGKVLGIGLLGLAQLLMAGGAALLAGRLAGGAGLPSVAPETVLLVVLWFVLGYVFYSVAFAAAGALVSRQEDLTAAMLPITLVLIGSFYLALIVSTGDPDSIVARVAAFLPPFAPMVVPARMVLGDMTVLGLAAAIVVDVVGTAALIVFAARVYERAILRVGAPVKLRRLMAPAMPVPASAELILRGLAVVLLLGGVAAGTNRPLGITLIALGVLIVVLLEARKRRPRPGAHR
jgi:ABC-2 type transport system permease protein